MKIESTNAAICPGLKNPDTFFNNATVVFLSTFDGTKYSKSCIF